MKKKLTSNFSDVNLGEVPFYGLGLLKNDNQIAMYNATGKDNTTLTRTHWSKIGFDRANGEKLNNASQGNVRLFIDDSNILLNCKAGNADIKCCKNNTDYIQWDQPEKKNVFTCISAGTFTPTTPWPGHYVCLSSPDEKGNMYKQLTFKDMQDTSLDQITTNPDICDLRNKTINIQATDLIDGDNRFSPMIQNFPLCSLIRNHIAQKTDSNEVTPGCADVDHRLNTQTAMGPWNDDDNPSDKCVYKDNIQLGKCANCGLNRVDLDNSLMEGVNTYVFTGPGTGNWGAEADSMCNERSTRKIEFNNTYNAPYNCNWNWDTYADTPCGSSQYDDGCALRFQLNNNKNPHACDNYNESVQYQNLCKNQDCSWTKDYNCPNQPTGKKGTATYHGNFDIRYHCCCDLDGWKNLKN